MAETPSKRLREAESHEDSNSKRQKPHHNILNLLDETEPAQEPSHELSQDLSAIFTILQQELASSSATIDFESLQSTAADEVSVHQADSGGGDEDEGVKSVMRHLLEASDDELGIPNPRDETNFVELGLNSGESFPFAFNDTGLWDLEDEAANYYTVLQSELFM